MSRTTESLRDDAARYLQATALLGEPELHARLRAETAELKNANMQISPEQGRLMGLIAQLVGARRAIEVGVFTGYSALWVAESLPPDGVLVACDVSEDYTAVARRYWTEAGVDGRIDLRLGPAAETLDAMIAAGEAGTFDLAFVDADKQNNETYFEQCLELLRAGGVVMIDNAFAGGRAFAPAPGDADARDIRDLTRKIMADARVDAVLVPVSDGLILARKR